MKLGYFEIYPILDGFFKLDGGAMFGRVPKEIWKKTNPPDRKNRILMALRCLLIQTGTKNILVDTGIGDQHSRKIIQRFAIDRRINLDDSLAQYGLSREDIDIVVNTHLHFDHCGGNTKEENGHIIPAFPQAQYFIQSREWDEATAALENILTRASYQRNNFLPLRNFEVVTFIPNEVTEVEKGVTLLRTGGHTRGHQIVKIESGGKTAIYLGDLVSFVSHLNYPFIAAYDLQPLETVRKKVEILPEAAENQTLLLFNHEPNLEAAFIKIEEKKILINEEVEL